MTTKVLRCICKKAYVVIGLFAMLASCHGPKAPQDPSIAFLELEDLYYSDLTASIGALDRHTPAPPAPENPMAL